ncbi:amidase [Arthrobacter sp. Leaf337]|uniref:amidase n=1 Tax=Arthrobacter sp. Leaf337 TaxID=1736342 RepID=UPI0006FD414A|nr:amidase [Arthrobacter sp. Leaf337]KQR80148.1 amidase [Arthrobacter sp. Leaf337]
MTASVLQQLNTGMLDATAIAEAVQNGSLTAFDVVAAARTRAQSPAGRAMNAFITEDWDRAARAAAAVDRRRAAGEALGPLAGVPFSVKDVIAVAGLPITGASKAFADTVATTTAPAVQRLLDADAILIGKTNCPEFAFGVTCDSPLLGRTGNPRFPANTPGGSSGGEAASLAAGISALGVGTDFGGSVRWPAQCVGVAALRPGIGSVPGDGQVPGVGGSFGANGTVPAASPGMQGTFQTIGPMARSVRDLRSAYLIMSGAEARGVADRQESTGGLMPSAGSRRPFRITWSDGAALGPVRAEVTALIERLAAALAGDGHTVRHQPDLFADCLPPYNRLRAVDPMVDHAAAVKGREDGVTAANLQTIQASFAATAADVEIAWQAANSARSAALTQLAAVDIALLPVAGGPAGDPDGRLDIDGQTAEGWEIMGHCRAVTLTGCPAVSLPVGLSNEGLPLSVQIVAGPGGELTALDFAVVLESLDI